MVRFALPRKATGSEIIEAFEKMEEENILPDSKVFFLDRRDFLRNEILGAQIGINQHIDSCFGEFWVQYRFAALSNKPNWWDKPLMKNNKYGHLSLRVYVRNETLFPKETVIVDTKRHRLRKYLDPYITQIEEFLEDELK